MARVVLTRTIGHVVLRIRECDTCDTRFNTEEHPVTKPRNVVRKPRKAKRVAIRILRRKGGK